MKKIKRKIKWKNVFLLLFIFICLILICINVVNIFTSFYNSNKTLKQVKKVQSITEVIESTDDSEVISQNDIDKNSPYWTYIKMNLIDVDFTELKRINEETIGWIQVNGTNINYPFVQTDNNDYYLNHSFDKSYNNAGWIFLDFRNNISNDKNSILYAHSMNNKTMFGSLKNLLTNDWLKDTSNHVIKLSTEKENTLWQVFSVYHIPTTTDYLQTNFVSDKTFYDFINMLKDRSNFIFNTSINETDRILTLSTCYNENEKMVIHAKLIKIEKKD